MKSLTTLIAAVGLVLSLCPVAAAHGGAHKTLMGTIRAVEATQIILVTTGDKQVTVALHPSTRYVTSGDEQGSWSELRSGMRVVVKLDEHEQTAGEVRYRRIPTAAPEGGTADE